MSLVTNLANRLVNWFSNSSAANQGSTIGTNLQATNNDELLAAALQQQEAAQASAERAMQFSHDEAALARQWQEEMSNTSYQRAMQDMEKAGLNPVLAFQQGGASTPAGATASSSAASMDSAKVDTETVRELIKAYLDVSSAENIAIMNNSTKEKVSVIQTLGKLFG